MGVHDNISIENIQHLLETVYLQFNGYALDPNNAFRVQKSVIKLYELLKDSSHKPEVIKPLYLPAILATENNQYYLVDSTKLVFIDSNRYENQDLTFSNTPCSLFQLPSDTKPSVVSTMSMATLHDIRSPDNMDICLQLPKETRPNGLSLCCTESILIRSERQENSSLSTHFLKLKDLLPHISQLLPTILLSCYRNDDTIINKFVSSLIDLISSVIPVINIVDLRSKLWLMSKNSKYHIGTLKVDFLLQKEDYYTLFVDVEASSSSYSLQRELARFLCIEVARIHNLSLKTFLKAVKPVCECLQVQCLNDLKPIFEMYKIEPPTIKKIPDNSVNLSKQIPNEVTFSLDRDIYHIFHPEEWVGYEVSEDYFIYAIVLYPLPDETDNPLAKKYKIIVDESEHGLQEVSTLDLYKLIPNIPEKQSESSELVLVDPDGATAQVRQVTDSQRLLEIKRTICKELKGIWKLKNEDEKKKAIKRLYLKYHPDKVNPNEHDLYDNVFKFLKRQIDRLEERLPLEDPDLAQEISHSTPHSSHWTHWYNDWDVYARKISTWRDSHSRRPTKTKDSTEVYGAWKMIDDLQPKQNPMEAERWLKQAESDRKAMIYLKEAPSALSCQVLFLAHEVSEKALKAGMYALVGLNPSSLKKHDLVCHANAISSVKGGDWTGLPNLVSSMEHYYLDSRFPNNHSLPDAPVDVYTKTQAEEMADNAEEVVKLIRRCVQ